MTTQKKMSDFVLLITALMTALIAGLFYAYSCSVNIGLGRLPDDEYLNAMQKINAAILNPWFFASFMGTLILLPVSTWLHFSAGNTPRLYLLLAASVIYVVAVFGVTVIGNVPLNGQLAAADLQKLSAQQMSELRAAFEKPWLLYHLIRTVAVIFTLVLVLTSLLQFKISDQ
ncbi:anthrone oxygenase family protein [Mucilaginibacter sp. HD30]